MAGARFQQGLYVPRNPHKYVGNLDKIRYMSSYELETHRFFDNNERVLRWSSEPMAIPYINTLDNRLHRYYPDYWVQYVTSSGEIVQELIEVKPMAQTKPPRKNSKHNLYEQARYVQNICKWEAAKGFCAKNGWKFRIITERAIFK